MARMDSPPPDDAVSPAPHRARGFGSVLLSAILSSAILAGVLWAVSRYVIKSGNEDYRIYVWVAIGGVVSRLLTWPLTGRRIPGLVVEVLAIALFAIVAYGGYVYVWPGVPLRLR